MMTGHSPTRTSIPSADHVAENFHLYLGSLALFPRESLSLGQVVSASTASTERLSNLGIDTRDLAILNTVADCRLVTTQQLQRLHFLSHTSSISGARACRRVLKRLSDKKILRRRERRIGGVRKGSASFVYSIGTVGIKLLENSSKQVHSYTTDPSDYFFEHTIELAELYTQLHELAIAKQISLLEVQTEPNCWRQYNTNNGKLRPDMFVRFTKADEEYSYFIELDRGTTHLPALIRKLQQYQHYYASGVEQQTHDIFPQVLWIVPDSKRVVALNTVIASLQNCHKGLFAVELIPTVIDFMCKLQE